MRSDIDGQLQIPARMKAKLEAYQSSVRRVKVIEGVLAALVGLLLSYILVFALDRVMETPALLRGAILLVGSLGLGLFFPLKCHKWVWGTRRMEQVARLLRHKFPRTSDQLLGIVELARSESEQTRSPVLVQAAMNQVDESIKDRDFSGAVPKPRHRRWALAAIVPIALILGAVAFSQAATSNAFVRWLMPWKDTERYTFAKTGDWYLVDGEETREATNDQIVVPYAEPFNLETQLRKDTEWAPGRGSARYNGQQYLKTDRNEDKYKFEVPPQKESGALAVSIGDIRKSIEVTPMTRPELKGVKAIYSLPDYLQYDHDITADSRSGVVSILNGSQVHFEARVSRELKSATLADVSKDESLAPEPGKKQDVRLVTSKVLTEPMLTELNVLDLIAKADAGKPQDPDAVEAKSIRKISVKKWLVEAGDDVKADTELCVVKIDDKEFKLVARAAGKVASLDVGVDDAITADQTIGQVECVARVNKWKKQVGDAVEDNDVLCELVATDVLTGEDFTVQQQTGDSGVITKLAITDETFVGSALLANLEEERVCTDETMVAESYSKALKWTDKHGLVPLNPFILKVNAVEDSPPVIGCELLDQKRVILAHDTIRFDMNVSDDFGVKKVGIEWQGIPDPLRNPDPAVGERTVFSGDPEETSVNGIATFSADTEGLKPQSFKIRIFAEDYLPDRERTYSAVYTVHVLSSDEHFAWMTDQMSRWLRQAEGVYEHELQLHDQNRQLRQLDAKEIDDPKNRRKIEQQAAAERANGARLSALTANGKKMIEEATRNEQFQVGHLETWAEMMQKLENMANNRMPKVSDLLKDAAKAPGQVKPSEGKSDKTPPSAGENKGNQSGKGGGEDGEDEEPIDKAPTVSDVESGMNKQDEQGGEDAPKPPSKGKLGLPNTILQGGPPQEPEECPPQEKMEEAVGEQAEILAEFEEIKDALNEVMGELENSTFVKRLKAASRRQLEVAADLNRTLLKSFGQEDTKLNDRQKNRAGQLAKREVAQSESVYLIQEDLEAYFNRKQETKFKEILDDMSDTRVVTKLRGLGDRITENLKGESIVRAEFWADTLDRWAEELVQPAPGGA